MACVPVSLYALDDLRSKRLLWSRRALAVEVVSFAVAWRVNLGRHVEMSSQVGCDDVMGA